MGVHTVYMGKKPGYRPKRREYRRTYIKQWREHRTLTQEQLAERVAAYLADRGIKDGYTYATIGRLENGKVGYTQIILEALADALQTDEASLLMRNPTDSDAIWSVWERAKPGDRLKIVDIAHTIVGKTGTGN